MQSLTRLAATLALTSAALISLPTLADEARYNQIALRAEVSQDVAHDLMHVTLYSEAQNSDPAKLAAETTQTLNSAVEQARQVKNVSVKLGSRNSYPVYDDKGQQIAGWRERAELRLESADFAALSKLTGELLKDLKMGSMDFAISNPSRKKTEDELLKEAVAAFKARAQLATEALGGQSYKLVNLSLNSAGFQPIRPMRMEAMASGMSLAKAAPIPEIEAGTSEVTVNADGVIEVQMP
ncbi:SIMPL domain-containing protein [Pseudomonas sp. 2FG]|uniref:SIMPL domain-containing protein n=1 Tax=Pseudomonas sp. 2FG TaxID=2502191 RepID=UPI0010F58FA3|nr:SIMPL domain-containing protein [Pseudomonas sp. 2FG]